MRTKLTKLLAVKNSAVSGSLQDYLRTK